MDLRKQILKAHSKNNCDIIVKWIGADPARFAELFRIFLNDEPMVVQRAAWPLSEAVIANPGLVKPFFARLIANLSIPGRHEAVRRNTIRLLEYVDIPKRFHATLLNLCFGYISDPNEKAAVKASSITVLDHLSAFYPEIKNELLIVLTDRFNNESPAYKARARRVLSKLRRSTSPAGK